MINGIRFWIEDQYCSKKWLFPVSTRGAVSQAEY